MKVEKRDQGFVRNKESHKSKKEKDFFVFYKEKDIYVVRIHLFSILVKLSEREKYHLSRLFFAVLVCFHFLCPISIIGA